MINYVHELNGLLAQQSYKITDQVRVQAISPDGEMLVIRDFHLQDNVVTLWLDKDV